jgi:hypothetical protein
MVISRGEQNNSKKSLLQCHFVHYKSYFKSLGLNPGFHMRNRCLAASLNKLQIKVYKTIILTVLLFGVKVGASTVLFPKFEICVCLPLLGPRPFRCTLS